MGKMTKTPTVQIRWVPRVPRPFKELRQGPQSIQGVPSWISMQWLVDTPVRSEWLGILLLCVQCGAPQ